MALMLQTGKLEKFVGAFYRTNANTPPPRPEISEGRNLTKLVITHGLLQLEFTDSSATVQIPMDDLVSSTRYRDTVAILSNLLVDLLQLPPSYNGEVNFMMMDTGLVAEISNGQISIQPLTFGQGELDSF